MTLVIKQTVILCHKDGMELFSVQNGDAIEHPCCPRCEPQRYLDLLKNAQKIEMLSPEQIRDRNK